MEKKKVFFTLLGLVVVLTIAVVGLTPKQAATASVGVPKTADSEAIQETIIKSYRIQEKAAETFDTSAFDSVFVNDARGLRGEKLPLSVIKFIQEATNQPSKTDFGILDYKVAYYVSEGKNQADWAELEAKLKKEKRDPTKDEIKAAGGGGRMLTLAETEPAEIKFISIAVDGDQAFATFDDGPTTNEMILVRIDKKWFIAGNKTLSVHP